MLLFAVIQPEIIASGVLPCSQPHLGTLLLLYALTREECLEGHQDALLDEHRFIAQQWQSLNAIKAVTDLET